MKRMRMMMHFPPGRADEDGAGRSLHPPSTHLRSRDSTHIHRILFYDRRRRRVFYTPAASTLRGGDAASTASVVFAGARMGVSTGIGMSPVRGLSLRLVCAFGLRGGEQRGIRTEMASKKRQFVPAHLLSCILRASFMATLASCSAAGCRTRSTVERLCTAGISILVPKSEISVNFFSLSDSAQIRSRLVGKDRCQALRTHGNWNCLTRSENVFQYQDHARG
ncbi:hypothetical protein B0H13DRAFT_268138 [Mycena leptocephala]|nr:hypothetical protein B0H13DRAFT_268138 [Mycena leptocephala]